jgi:ATP-binding cassette subfamily B (MDR/TAP) protein 1
MFFVVALGNMVAYGIIGFTFNIVSQVSLATDSPFLDFVLIKAGLKTVTHRYRLEMFDIILKQDMDFFDQPENSSGALTSRISNLPTQLQELIGVNIMLIFVVLVNIVSSSALALAFGWKLGLVVIFGGLPALLASGYLRIRLETKLNAINEERFSESASLASEAVMAIRTVASLTMETAILEEYSQMLRGIAQRSTKSLPWMLVLFSLSQSLDFLVMALGFWYGSQLLSTGEYNTTQFYIIFIGVVFAGQAAAQFFTHTTSITNATGAANYILWLRTLKPVMQENKGSCTNAPKGDGRILLDDVEYRYPQREASWVLKGLSVNIEPGQYAAIVGPSGCGKSTMISLLERFYDPTSGRICFDDEDIKTFSPRLYRQSIALVQQEPTLYQGSVRANISIGLETGPTDAEIEAACQQANALEFIQSLPEGFQTPCGSRGLQFSGGQRQRIAIARALIRNPALLLLDEATSALDTESERVVQTALDEAATKRTTVAVAHRLSTIRNADVIFVFANGKIAEQGTHGDLQRMKGIYHEMCLAQSLDQA